MNLDGLSMHALTEELKKNLLGGRIDKITQQNKVNFTFTIRQPGKTFLLKISVAPQNPAMYLVEKPAENLPEPSTFCMVLRKNLENGRISDIRQHGLDRIIFIDADNIGAGGKIQTVTLAAELIGKYSNLILIHEEKIIDALKKIGTNSSRVRTVLPNQIYQMPPEQNKENIFAVNLDEVSKNLQADKSVMNFFQGFGPQTTHEVIFQSQKIGLKNSLEKIADNIKNPTPCFVQDAGKILAISAVDLNYLTGEKKFFETISEMLETADEIMKSFTPPDKEKFLKLVHNELKRAKFPCWKMNLPPLKTPKILKFLQIIFRRTDIILLTTPTKKFLWQIFMTAKKLKFLSTKKLQSPPTFKIFTRSTTNSNVRKILFPSR